MFRRSAWLGTGPLVFANIEEPARVCTVVCTVQAGLVARPHVINPAYLYGRVGSLWTSKTEPG